VTESKID